MSRGIRMNVFMNKAMINQAKKQSMEHSKNNKTRKQELIKKYEKRQRTGTSPKKLSNQTILIKKFKSYASKSINLSKNAST